ncbi:MAG: hypothetical protein L0206_18570, partial [Actinobacteria bacterium]|nr:hypothetical protein [Actinomycetota bacterium]
MTSRKTTIVALFLLAGALHPCGELGAQQRRFERADSNTDGEVNIGDPIHTLFYQFFGQPPALACADAADANDDGAITIVDPLYSLNYLFADGPSPPPPFEACGEDPTADPLGCDTFSACEAGEECENSAPAVMPIDDQQVVLGTTLAFSVEAVDPEGDPVTLDVAPVPLPQGASFDPVSGRFSFHPETDQIGSFELAFSARDDGCAVALEAERVAITVVPSPSGRTSLRGLVLTLGNEPLMGVRLEIAGRQTFTDARGEYFVDGLPSGRQRLLIDGSTIDPALGVFATVPELITLIEGGANVLEPPIFLIPLDVASGDVIDPAVDSVVTSGPIGPAGQPVTLTVAAGTARNEETGQLFEGLSHISSIPSPDLGPRPLPDDMDLSVYIALQPFGVKYDPPAPIAFPNVEGFPVGAIVDIFGLNHDTGRMEKLGEGQVTPDGMVSSIGGVVRNNSWHGFVPQPPEGGPNPPGPPGPSPCPEGSGGSSVDVTTGDLQVEHDLVGYRSLGVFRALRLEYHSSTAYPRPVVGAQVTTGNLTPPPLFMALDVAVGGIDLGRVVSEAPGFCPFNCPFVLQRHAVDATRLPTGIYPAAVTVDCQFPISRRSRTFTQSLPVVNAGDSPFGVGWQLFGLPRIHRAVTGELFLTRGDASGISFIPAVLASSEITGGEQDFYHFAGNRGEVVSIRMRRRSNQPDGSGTLDPALTLLSSTGLVLARDDDNDIDFPSGPGANALIAGFILPATDTYTIVASGRGGSRGAYDLFLTTSSESPLAPGQIRSDQTLDPSFDFSGEITASVESGVHTFAANAGTTVNINANRAENDGGFLLDPLVELHSSAGIVIARDDDSGTNQPPGPGRNARIANLVLPATDTYRVVVRGSGGSRGTYALRIRLGSVTGEVRVEENVVSISRAVISPPREFSTLFPHDDGSFTRILRDGTIIEFDGEGRQTAAVDRNGNRLEYAYDGTGRPTEIRDPVGRITRLRYTDGKIAAIEDPVGRLTRFDHDSRGRLVRITDPDATERTFEYDDRHLMTRKTNKRGQATLYEYDFSGRFVRSLFPDGSERTLVSEQGIGLVDPASGAGTVDTPAPVVPRDEVESRFTFGGITRSYRLGASGNLETIIDPAGLESRIDRNAIGEPTAFQLPSGEGYSYTYDDRGNLTSVTDEAMGGTRRYAFEPGLGEVAEWTDALGRVTRFFYDERGNQTSKTSREGRSTSTVLDDRGLVTSFRDIIHTVAILEYDAQGNLARMALDDGALARSETLTYTSAGLVESVTNALDEVLHFEYDVMGRLISRTLPDGHTVAFEYDAAGNLTSVTSEGRPAHTFAYTHAGLASEYVAPDVGAGPARTRYLYNAAQQLTRIERPDGTVVGYEYDAAGRIDHLTLARGAIEYTYDPRTGLLARVTAPDGGSVSYTYRGRFPLEVTWSGAVSGTVGRTYDLNGNITSHEVSGAGVIEYAFDADELIVAAGDLRIRRAQNSLVQGMTLGAVVETVTWNGFRQPMSRRASFGETELYSVRLTRDAIGRITEKVETIDGISTTYSYEYTASRRLRAVLEDGVTIAEYAYDASGNRVTHTGPNGTAIGSYDDQDRLRSHGNTTYTYNANGDLASRTSAEGTTSYEYDEMGSLLSVTLPDGTLVEYLIDARNRRVGRSVDGVLVQGLLYQDRFRPIAELDGEGNVVSRFVYAVSVGAPEYMIRDGVAYRIILDHLGSPRLVVDSTTGAIAQRMDYDAFGRVVLDTNPGFQPFGFAGGLHDPLTGLTRFGLRDYDAETGRWTTKDPVLFAGEDPNLYAYAFGDPVNLVDRTGLTANGGGGGSDDDVPEWLKGPAEEPPPEVPPGYSEVIDDPEFGYQHTGRNEDGTYFDIQCTADRTVCSGTYYDPETGYTESYSLDY